jgi:RNA polymerase sigma-70 factor (ECF subfamily)
VPDPITQHESFIRLLVRHEPGIRALVRSVVHRAEDVDEVMQRVSLVAWQKFSVLTDTDGFGRWACVIARHEVLKFQRERARDRFVLDPDLIERILAEGEQESPVRERRLSLLEQCLGKLSPVRRDLLLQAYTPGCTTRAIAAKLGCSEQAMYQSLRRLRLELRRCVELGLGEPGDAP